jgi:hypothetical protein
MTSAASQEELTVASHRKCLLMSRVNRVECHLSLPHSEDSHPNRLHLDFLSETRVLTPAAAVGSKPRA